MSQEIGIVCQIKWETGTQAPSLKWIFQHLANGCLGLQCKKCNFLTSTQSIKNNQAITCVSVNKVILKNKHQEVGLLINQWLIKLLCCSYLSQCSEQSTMYSPFSSVFSMHTMLNQNPLSKPFCAEHQALLLAGSSCLLKTFEEQ